MRVIVKVTRFKNKKFNDFVTLEDAQYQIFKPIGLELSRHHGTTFMRADEDKNSDHELIITNKLKHPVPRA
jgi:hypothetical protein